MRCSILDNCEKYHNCHVILSFSRNKQATVDKMHVNVLY